MPDVLAARNLKTLAKALCEAKSSGASRIWGIGGHVIKVGVAPLIIDLIKRGFISAVAANGSIIIHDFEVAAFGATSENVVPALDDGAFGMTRETGEFLNNAITKAADEDLGLGEAVGKAISESDLPNREHSILGAAYGAEIPVTVHVAIGADVIHMHPSMDGAATGKTSHADFLVLANEVSKLEGGVFINFGSAVVLPEVFLKALALARNTGHKVDCFTTANFDMYRHYRPTVNILQRPTQKGGQAFDFSGHHEIMLPLLYQLLTEDDAEA
ncbi:MAG: hypothetical protein E3J72_15125 [Planctomycetota bacterium]|nr:MAG: hypothetical protein E3J72_15125 [Planctomycetota bacterium]